MVKLKKQVLRLHIVAIMMMSARKNRMRTTHKIKNEEVIKTKRYLNLFHLLLLLSWLFHSFNFFFLTRGWDIEPQIYNSNGRVNGDLWQKAAMESRIIAAEILIFFFYKWYHIWYSKNLYICTPRCRKTVKTSISVRVNLFDFAFVRDIIKHHLRCDFLSVLLVPFNRVIPITNFIAKETSRHL